MVRHIKPFKSFLLALAIAATGATAYAAKGAAQNDALAIANARISLTQAIAAAEQHANGKAVKAEFEESRHGRVFEVEVVSGTKVFDVKVDADNGTVLSSAEDEID